MANVRSAYRRPTVVKIAGRSSSITNSFAQMFVPAVDPTDEEIIEALRILGQSPDDVRCVYCGDRSTEWDHLRPLVRNQRPTGYITEIRNLVPACGKCNQSKGSQDWRSWIAGKARLSPQNRGVIDIESRAAKLNDYENWGKAVRIDFEAAAGDDLWSAYWESWRKILMAMNEAQVASLEICQRIESAYSTGEHRIVDNAR